MDIDIDIEPGGCGSHPSGGGEELEEEEEEEREEDGWTRCEGASGYALPCAFLLAHSSRGRGATRRAACPYSAVAGVKGL